MRTIRIADGVCAVMLLLVLGACGGGSASGDATTFSSTDTTGPTVSITSPSASGSYATMAATVALAGSASDNVGVASVSWRNAANGATGNASGTSSWSTANIALVPGVNTIRVTARDAAGNTGGSTLAVSYDPSGATGLSGSVDSSLINRNGVNMVYAYSGMVVPDDVGSTTPPVATAPVTQDNGVCTFSYRLGVLTAGTYTVAFVNQTDNPAADDAITFRGTAQVTVAAGGGAIHDFQPIRPPLRVGPNRTFTLPSAAAAVAQAGDVIEIDAGEYLNDNVVWRVNNLTLRGVGGGRAHMRATALIPDSNGKGIWVTSAQNTTVENIEFSGARVTDENGAGIRADGPGLTVCNGYFHGNENGILGGSGNVLVEYSEFGHNGQCPPGTGCAHNMYITSGAQRFTLRYSYSHHANEGHTVKSRALENHILYNRIMDEADGNSSYKIDIPDGGRTFIIGNVIQRGPLAQNSNMVAYAAESTANGTLELYVVNNTFVNDAGGGAFLSIGASPSGKIVNNIFAGGGSVPTGTATRTVTSNLTANPSSVAGLVDRANFDYRLAAGSPAIDAGSDPGLGAGISLAPTSHYLHPASRQDRPSAGTIDIGAYELQ